MSTSLKCPIRWRNVLNILIMAGFLIGVIPVLGSENPQTEVDLIQGFTKESLENKLAIIQGNSLLPISNPSAPDPQVVRKIKVIVTGYSSSPQETDSNPYLTAAETWVREGIVANNLLPFGTKIRLPEIYGDKIFVVEDRMHWKKGYYHVDIWFSSSEEALNFGAKKAYIEILES